MKVIHIDKAKTTTYVAVDSPKNPPWVRRKHNETAVPGEIRDLHSVATDLESLDTNLEKVVLNSDLDLF